jgi:hypothetical protein
MFSSITIVPKLATIAFSIRLKPQRLGATVQRSRGRRSAVQGNGMNCRTGSVMKAGRAAFNRCTSVRQLPINFGERCLFYISDNARQVTHAPTPLRRIVRYCTLHTHCTAQRHNVTRGTTSRHHGCRPHQKQGNQDHRTCNVATHLAKSKTELAAVSQPPQFCQ